MMAAATTTTLTAMPALAPVLRWWEDEEGEEVGAALEVVLVDVDEDKVVVVELGFGAESVDWEVGRGDVLNGVC